MADDRRVAVGRLAEARTVSRLASERRGETARAAERARRRVGVLPRRASWLLALAVACGSPEPSDAGGDAGRDGGRDGGRDAGRDGGRDSGPAALADSGSDARVDGGPDDPGWVPLATLAEGCTIERALHPERLFEVRWEPCEDGTDGCHRIASDVGLARSPGWFDGDQGYFTVIRGEPPGRRVVVIARTEGSPVAAWREPPSDLPGACIVIVGIGDGYAAVMPSFFHGEDRTRDVDYVFHAPIDAIGTTTEPLAIIRPSVLPQRLAVSSQVIAVWNGPAIYAIAADGRHGYVSVALPGIAQSVTVAGPDVMWEDWAELVRIAHGAVGRPGTLYHRADPADIKGFHTDGVDLAWVQGYDRQPDGSYARLELWTAPYVADPSELRPRLVRLLDPTRHPSAFGGGWYVTMPGAPWRIEAVRLEDGTRRQWISSLRGALSYPPIYVTDHEILLQDPALIRLDPNRLPRVDE